MMTDNAKDIHEKMPLNQLIQTTYMDICSLSKIPMGDHATRSAIYNKLEKRFDIAVRRATPATLNKCCEKCGHATLLAIHSAFNGCKGCGVWKFSTALSAEEGKE